MPYWIIGAFSYGGPDYSFAVVYSCSATFGTDLWILSRESTMSSQIYNSLVAKVNSMGIDTNALGLTLSTQGAACVY